MTLAKYCPGLFQEWHCFLYFPLALQGSCQVERAYAYCPRAWLMQFAPEDQAPPQERLRLDDASSPGQQNTPGIQAVGILHRGLAEQFPARVRYAGASIAYTFAGVFAGGLAPLAFTKIYQASHDTDGIVIYAVVALLITSWALWSAHPKLKSRPKWGDGV